MMQERGSFCVVAGTEKNCLMDGCNDTEISAPGE